MRRCAVLSYLQISVMEKQSLDIMWEEAMERFRILTKQSLHVSPPRTLEDVRKQIELYQSDSSDDQQSRGGKERAKRMSLNALSCIKLLGGVAAQGASMVCFRDEHSS